MDEEFLRALKLYNEKVGKLLNSRFLQHLKEKGMNVNLKVDQQGTTLRHNLPDQEAIDAFILNIRYFNQDNEMSSLRNLAKKYNNSKLSDELKKEFNFARDRLNEELDKNSNIKISRDLTNGDIFDIFIYGGIAHADSQKKKTYDSWKQNTYVYYFLEMSFNNILFYFLNVIVFIRNVNQKAIKELES